MVTLKRLVVMLATLGATVPGASNAIAQWQAVAAPLIIHAPRVLNAVSGYAQRAQYGNSMSQHVYRPAFNAVVNAPSYFMNAPLEPASTPMYSRGFVPYFAQPQPSYNQYTYPQAAPIYQSAPVYQQQYYQQPQTYQPVQIYQQPQFQYRRW